MAGLNREELAAQIFIRSNRNPEDSFKLADAFLAYAQKQREPEACEKPKSHGHCGDIYCPQCNTTFAKPEPPKPERKAREWNLKINDNGNIIASSPSDALMGAGWIKVREILPEDGK